MSSTRREIIGQSLVLGGAAAAVSLGLPASRAEASRRSRRDGKRILILGGTGFLGPKTVEAALARGHRVTVFNRGKTEKRIPFEFKDVEHLYGNRDPDLPADDEKGPDGKLLRPDAKPKGLEQLFNKEWDAVIDNSGYYPRMVKASAQMLERNAKQYVYISSISAYADNKTPGADEDAPLARLADPSVETMGRNYENYGGLKAACEKIVEAVFPDHTAIVRPGYIVGPGDPTDRFTYWPVRISKGGEVLAPGSPDDPIQWIDVRDLAEWLVKLVEDETAGEFNAIGLPAHWGEVLAGCVAAAKSGAKLNWVPAEWLEKNGMGGEDAFPIWAPPTGDYAGSHLWRNERAVNAGLRFRTVDDTVKGILDWYPKDVERRKRVTKEMQDDAKAKGQPPPKAADPEALRAGPSREREKELLAAFAAAKKG